jgi:hypothetical protein
MRNSLAALALTTALLSGESALAQDHLVTPQAAQERLAEAETARQRDLARLDGLLSSSEAAVAARVVGADLDAVRRAAPTLSDAELREIAARAAALDRDPVAGVSDSDIRLLLFVFLIVVIVVLVVAVAD